MKMNEWVEHGFLCKSNGKLPDNMRRKDYGATYDKSTSELGISVHRTTTRRQLVARIRFIRSPQYA